MESRVRLLGHPIHQMLIVFPLGLLATAVVFDLIFLVAELPVFAVVAWWMIAAGLVGGIVAAPFGFVDWLLAIPSGSRAKRIGAIHGLGNALMLLLFFGSLMLRSDAPAETPAIAYVLSFAGAGLALITSWLGGELVDRLGIGVYEDANPDAPSSLQGKRGRVASSH